MGHTQRTHRLGVKRQVINTRTTKSNPRTIILKSLSYRERPAVFRSAPASMFCVLLADGVLCMVGGRINFNCMFVNLKKILITLRAGFFWEEGVVIHTLPGGQS